MFLDLGLTLFGYHLKNFPNLYLCQLFIFCLLLIFWEHDFRGCFWYYPFSRIGPVLTTLTWAVLIDLLNAPDNINHELLIAKLHNIADNSRQKLTLKWVLKLNYLFEDFFQTLKTTFACICYDKGFKIMIFRDKVME